MKTFAMPVVASCMQLSLGLVFLRFRACDRVRVSERQIRTLDAKDLQLFSGRKEEIPLFRFVRANLELSLVGKRY